MFDPGHGSSMMRQTLVAVGAMVGGSGLFVTVVTMVLTLAVDRAVDPGQASTTHETATAASAKAPAASPRPAAAPTAVARPQGGRT